MLIARRTILVLGLAASLHFAGSAAAQEPIQSATFGVVFDGPAGHNDTLRTLIQGAIAERLGRDHAAYFPPEKELVADWSTEGARRAIDRLLRDRDVNMVLTLGAIGSDIVARWPRPLGKPVVAASVIDATLQDLPARDGASGVPNLTYVATPRAMDGDLTAFLLVTPIHHLAILVSQAYDDAIPTLRQNLDRLPSARGMSTSVVPVVTTAADVLRRLPSDADAVYITDLAQLADTEMERLAEALRDRHLPSYTVSGIVGVRQGFLLSARPDSADERMVRAVAAVVDRVLHGEAPARLPVFSPRDMRLAINTATARAIGLAAPWAVLAEAEEVGGEDGDSARAITLAGAVREAVARNLDLAAQDWAIAGGEARVRGATAPLLPQLTGLVGAVATDRDRAAARLGLSPERSVDAGLRLSQSVFSEGRRAAAAIERRRQDAREQVRDQLRLDVILESATAYVELLRATALEAIHREHLRSARAYQETAEIREASGTAAAGEVTRWEVIVAGSRQAIVHAESQRRQTTIRLNRLLHREMESPLKAEEAVAADLNLILTEPRLERQMRTRDGLRALRTFLAREADVGAPELRQLDAAIAGESRALGAATRAFFLPDVWFEAAVDDRLAASGAGRASPIPSVATPDDLRWSVGLRLSYPIFSGRARGAAKTQAAADLADLEMRREAARERVEERVRSALLTAGASLVTIELARDAADAAGRNETLVSESYRRGHATVTDLVDSQGAALAARLAATGTAYDFLEDALVVERAVGSFSFFATREDRQKLLDRLDTFSSAGAR